jgi:hypothetical protein
VGVVQAQGLDRRGLTLSRHAVRSESAAAAEPQTRAGHASQAAMATDVARSLRAPAAEEAPIGLILCTEVSREQVELLEMHQDGIAVAEYWTALPPKAEVQARLVEIVRDAHERVARREINTALTDAGYE